MREIRFHGRGGQGALTASLMLAQAAFIDGRYCQSFIFIGAERRGAPVEAYTRLDDKPIRVRCRIYHPDHIIVLDTSLIGGVDVTRGLKEGGLIVVNSDMSAREMGLDPKFKIYTIDANSIAIEHGLGTPIAPIVNTAILGAYAAFSDEVGIEALFKAIYELSPSKPDQNVEAARKAYEVAEWIKRNG
ncbi:TPA: pyruvate ferredoxin oxidoreductase [Candidatus Poribacteria bacterium]|nr:pyruvate ferredoxin oxidoreductase [Candidatus Poribacteria bacterium]